MFLIQSLPRCGTHLVRTALQSHGDILCFGEVFNPYSREHGFPVVRPTVADVLDHCRARPTPTGFQAHLGVASRTLIPGTVKVGGPLEETISNLDEVRRWLADTRYAAFLEMP